MKSKIMRPLPMFAAGALLGIISKLTDIYTENLGNVFSEFSVWILIGVLVTLNSPTRKLACINVFVMCAGMLAAYYLTAEATGSVYGTAFIIGWSAFSTLSPVFAYLTYKTKEKNIFSAVISAGIAGAVLASSAIFFDGPRAYDLLISLYLIYILFLKNKRETRRKV